MRVEKGPGWELRLGRYQDVLQDVHNAATIITDPPYSDRTHKGHRRGVGCDGEEKRMRVDNRNGSVYSVGANRRRDITYDSWSLDDAKELISFFNGTVVGWWVIITDHIMAREFEELHEADGRYVFAPLPFVAPGSSVRLAGDGPSSWTRWIIVARPKGKPYSNWGTLKGAYVLSKGYSEKGMFIGGKPLWLMEELIRDYTRPGDLVVDPCAGMGTTLLAAVIEGRQAIGAEVDEETFEQAVKRLRSGFTPSLFSEIGGG